MDEQEKARLDGLVLRLALLDSLWMVVVVGALCGLAVIIVQEFVVVELPPVVDSRCDIFVDANSPIHGQVADAVDGEVICFQLGEYEWSHSHGTGAAN